MASYSVFVVEPGAHVGQFFLSFSFLLILILFRNTFLFAIMQNLKSNYLHQQTIEIL